jgi:putative component of membrane protein insertase Oxa1/YidC/SpoIIIJ protein YidD
MSVKYLSVNCDFEAKMNYLMRISDYKYMIRSLKMASLKFSPNLSDYGVCTA